jgi:hypothetical protein
MKAQGLVQVKGVGASVDVDSGSGAGVCDV